MLVCALCSAIRTAFYFSKITVTPKHDFFGWKLENNFLFPQRTIAKKKMRNWKICQQCFRPPKWATLFLTWSREKSNHFWAKFSEGVRQVKRQHQKVKFQMLGSETILNKLPSFFFFRNHPTLVQNGVGSREPPLQHKLRWRQAQ